MQYSANIHLTGGHTPPTLQDQWRAIILFGRNVASYKFALAKALHKLGPEPGALIKLSDLALPFALEICDHLKKEDKQATSATSSFLDACRQYNKGALDLARLAEITESKGFVNVIDAFHRVGRADTPDRFFLDERASNKAIRVTDGFGRMSEQASFADLGIEVESRWRLVETAWRLGLGRHLVVTHDPQMGTLLLPDRTLRRTPVTSCRDALNGYQQGRCFYCSAHISLNDGATLADVDHFFAHRLKQASFGVALDGVWNLVLACQECNRGAKGKFDKLPAERFLARLHARNEHLINSHHPLRETLIEQTGSSEPARRTFLRDQYARAWGVLIHKWEPN